jgi:hypothetical protein
MRNNKLSRKNKQEVVVQQDGTEVIHSKESRAKVRRWSFVADIQIHMPDVKEEDTGVTKPGAVLPPRTLKLDTLAYTNAYGAKLECTQQTQLLRDSSPMFANSDIKVRAIPHETISNTTLNQLNGYRDMSILLDKALELAIKDANDVVLGRSVGGHFVETPASEGVKAITMKEIKEAFYNRARSEFKPKEHEDVSTTAQGSTERSDDPASIGEISGDQNRSQIILTDAS